MTGVTTWTPLKAQLKIDESSIFVGLLSLQMERKPTDRGSWKLPYMFTTKGWFMLFRIPFSDIIWST